MRAKRTFESRFSKASAPADFAAKATDLQALRDAVVDAAAVGGGLWLSYLFVFLYLAIAAGAVTHKDLFLENPVKLPFLNVELPLLGFFFLGPLLFVILHAYTLLHFTMLADKVGAFQSELQARIAEETGERLRRQLPSNIFVQFLSGPQDIRHGAVGVMLRLIAQLSLVLGPIALLVFFVLQFLPYHNELISWWQRLLVVADLVLLWVLWPSIARGRRVSLGCRDLRRGKVALPLAASLSPVVLVFTIATFPGEWLEAHRPLLEFPAPWKKEDPPWRKVEGEKKVTSLHELLVAGGTDYVRRRPMSLWSNVLVLPGEDFIDHSKFDIDAKFAAVASTISLRGRDLHGAILIEARLRKADFTGAQLQGASLQSTDLRDAKFECAERNSSNGCAELQGASLDLAQLQGASLDNAQLQGASLDNAELQGASLARTQLQGASLVAAQLQGASLVDVFVYRVSGGPQIAGARVERPEIKPRYRFLDCVPPNVCGFSPAAFATLKKMIGTEVPAGRFRDDALRRMARLDPDDQSIDAKLDPPANRWKEFEAAPPDRDEFEKGLADIFNKIGCAADGAPYVVHYLTGWLGYRFAPGSSHPAVLAQAFLDDTKCPGARGLTDADKAKLRDIAAKAPPADAHASPKPGG
jgi:hypothetical protein